MDATDGPRLWTLSSDNRPYPARSHIPPVVGDGVVHSGWGTGLQALDAATGERRWTSFSWQDFGPVEAGGFLYTCSSAVVALDCATGEKRWYVNCKRWGWPPVVAEGAVYHVDQTDTRLCAVDAVTGKPRWEAPFECRWPARPVVADGTVYVRRADGHLCARWA